MVSAHELDDQVTVLGDIEWAFPVGRLSATVGAVHAVIGHGSTSSAAAMWTVGRTRFGRFPMSLPVVAGSGVVQWGGVCLGSGVVSARSVLGFTHGPDMHALLGEQWDSTMHWSGGQDVGGDEVAVLYTERGGLGHDVG